MGDAPFLQPTLWRTCRVLANRTRLQMFGVLVNQPGQTVSDIATRLSLSLPVASEYLRAMEARGLLTVRRSGRWVKYRSAPDSNPDAVSEANLVAALKKVFRNHPEPVEFIFKMATAFTHPRRIDIFRALRGAPCPFSRLQTSTGISSWALVRHLGKLEARGFVTRQKDVYAVVERADGFGRELSRLAAE
jgi:DNA-binding transcriptional ArsR family regulator